MPDALWRRLELAVPEKERAEFIRQAVAWALDLRGAGEQIETLGREVRDLRERLEKLEQP